MTSSSMIEMDPHLTTLPEIDGTAPEWLRAIREEGMATFRQVGFPTTKMEDWKYTNVSAITSTPFRRGARAKASASVRRLVEGAGFGVGSQMVFVEGRFVPDLSSLGSLPDGVRVSSLARALERSPDLVRSVLGRVADPKDDGFAALNSAFLEEGAFVEIGQGVTVEEPIHVLFVTGRRRAPTMCHPRNVFIARDGSRATIVESYAGVSNGSYLTNAITEMVVGAEASIHHCKIQRESMRAFHIAGIHARQDRSSRFASCSISLGGGLVRNGIRAVLGAEGAQCSLDGLYMAGGRQHVDHHTTIDHQSPRCTSRELYKGVLDGRATGVFNGKVLVRADAQKSDAQQVNKNLLLSRDAVVNTKPQLEILADDVRCSHGATIGRLDENALFYLRSRGIDAAMARDLLIYAFANDLIGRIGVGALRRQLEEILASRLQGIPALEADL